MTPSPDWRDDLADIRAALPVASVTGYDIADQRRVRKALEAEARIFRLLRAIEREVLRGTTP